VVYSQGRIDTSRRRRGPLFPKRALFNEEGKTNLTHGHARASGQAAGIIAQHVTRRWAKRVLHLLSPQQPDHSIDDERAEASCSSTSAVEVQVRAPRHGIPAMHGTVLVTLHGPACRLGPCLGLPLKPVRRHWPSSNVGVCGLMAACQHVPIQTFGKHPDSDNRSA
jgi:hypothetical protein